ncbi:MAG: hypothetical protein RRY95_06525 [Oscillospiraceae bacterium]
MQQEEMRSFGYLCPKCGKPVLAERSVFALEASGVAIACDCGGSTLRAESDGAKFHLSVPCGICGETHQATCEQGQLLTGDGVGFGCPDTHQICCYIGTLQRVEPALRELEAIAALDKDKEPDAFADSVVMYEVLSELKEIAARPDGITCACGSHSYGMEVRHTAVDLVCRACGARLRIPAVTAENLDQLCCRMTLKIQ